MLLYIVIFYMQAKEAKIECCEFLKCGLSDESIYNVGCSFLFLLVWGFLITVYTHLRPSLQVLLKSDQLVSMYGEGFQLFNFMTGGVEINVYVWLLFELV